LLAGGVACASVPPPTDTIRAAEQAIDEATRADAEPHARLELHMAREHLEEARDLVDAERYDPARRLAEKALVEAQLAEAKANSARAQRNAEELREHITTLRREIDRTPEVTR
jgi:hypothetical protein